MIRDGERRREDQTKDIQHLKTAMANWQAGAGVVNWMIRVAIAIISAVAGIFGYEGMIRH